MNYPTAIPRRPLQAWRRAQEGGYTIRGLNEEEQSVANSTSSKTQVHQYGTLRFWTEETPAYSMKVAEGFLSAPNRSPRNKKEHELISKGTGDHAGHLIARRFGGPDAACNFTRQNYLQNRGGGTYYQAESTWAAALAEGARVHVIVRAKTRSGETRTFYREAEWTITSKTGQKIQGKVSYLNNESDKTREASGIPTMQYATPAPIIPIRRI